MNALDRYIAVHVVVGIAFALAILLAMFTFIDFVDELGSVGRGEYDYADSIVHVMLTTPLRAFNVFPIAAVVGSLLGLGVMSANRELVAVRAAGVSVARISGSVLKAAAILVLLAVLTGEVLAPRTETIARDLRSEALAEQLTSRTGAGFWARDGASFINIGEVQPDDRLGRVRIYEFDEDGRRRVATEAASASFTEDGWRLEDVRQSEIDDDGVVSRDLGRALWSSDFRPDLVKLVRVDAAGLSSIGLVRYIAYLRSNDLSAVRFELALAKKIVYPLACAVMIFLALPLVLGRLGAGGVGPRVVAGSMLGIGFHILNEASGHVGIVYGLNPFLSASAPTLAFLVIALAMMRRIN